MNNKLLDGFGELLIKNVRDRSLGISMNIVKRTTPNQLDLERYKVFENLTDDEKEAVCDLLSETITDTLYNFLEMFEENPDKMKLMLVDDDKLTDMVDISEKMGSEIACYDDDEGWIQRYSEIGRFVL